MPEETAPQPGRSRTIPPGVHLFTNLLLVPPLLYLSLGLAYVLLLLAHNQFQSRRLLLASLALGCLMGGGLALCWVRTRWKAQLVLFGSTLFGMLFLLEVFLAFRGRDYADLSRIARHCHRLGLPYDDRTGLEVILAARARGARAYPCVHPSAFWSGMYQFDLHSQPLIPLGGVSDAYTVVQNEFGYWFTYQSDERGFHNPPGLHAPGPLEVVLLGDSCTQGCSVRSEESFAALLRADYPRTLNLGLRGNGPLTELASLREYGAPHRPRAVLWFFYEGNDLADLEQEKRTDLARYLEPGYRQPLYAETHELNQALARWADQQVAREANYVVGQRDLRHYEPWTSILLFRRLRQARALLQGGPDAALPLAGDPGSQAARVAQPDFDTFGTVLARAREEVRGWGGTLVFFYLPQYSRYSDPSRYQDPCVPVPALVRRLGIPFVDLRDSFRRVPDPLALFPFREAGHYTPEGYRLVADAARKELQRLLPRR